MYACMENMIRNILLGNECSTPRAKGVQAVYVSKICEGHVSKISQSLQNASSSKGVRAGLIWGLFQKKPSWRSEKRERACPGILPSPTRIIRETGQERDLPRAIHTTESGRNCCSSFGQEYFYVRRVEPSSAKIWQAQSYLRKPEKQTIINVAIWRLSRVDWLG